jgi:mono/diheme cytochrome c family protein
VIAVCRLTLLALVVAGCARERLAFPHLEDRLVFVDRVDGRGDGKAERWIDKRTLAERGLEIVRGFDPYYQRDKRFWAVPLAPVLKEGFAGVDLAGSDLVLHAEDGYAVPLEGGRLLDGTAYLALGDADHPASWDPIGPRRSDPLAFYLVWKGPDRTDLERYPRPWGLVRVERARFEQLYPHLVPPGGDETVRRGLQLFRRDCVRCHAINREGGRIGPDLNVPRSIVEYRPAEQIRAYIRDPMTFRYGAMPAHPHLTEADLDALVAYLDAMKDHKHDPESRR